MSIQVKLSYEELILNALARVKHPKGERDVIARGAREWAAIRAVLAPLYEERRALAERVRAAEHIANSFCANFECDKAKAVDRCPAMVLGERIVAALRPGAPRQEA